MKPINLSVSGDVGHPVMTLSLPGQESGLVTQ